MLSLATALLLAAPGATQAAKGCPSGLFSVAAQIVRVGTGRRHSVEDLWRIDRKRLWASTT